jgi:hypothetical protein
MSDVIPVHLAVEDELSEAVLRKVMAQCQPGFAIGCAYRPGGFGYLRRTVAGSIRLPEAYPSCS